MKNRLLLYALAFLLFQVSSLNMKADIDSSAIAKALKPVADAIDTKLNKLDSSGKKLESKVDSLKRFDSSNYKSFSKALEQWKNESKKHYEKTFGSFGFLITLFLLIGLIAGYLLVTKSAICRDESYDQQTLQPKQDMKRRPFSYSRVQYLWWTLIILSCYAPLCIFFKDLIPLNATVIMLLGGGLSVSVFGKVIDSSQAQDDGVRHIRHQDINDSAGFFTDILSDESGVSVHRLQALLFNIIFGVGFIMTCIANVSDKLYPFTDFELWQFTLLGISAAGYLGLKTGENSKGSEDARIKQAIAAGNQNAAKEANDNAPKAGVVANDQPETVADEANFSNTPAQG